MADLWQSYGSWALYALFFLVFMWLHGWMHGGGGGHVGHGRSGGCGMGHNDHRDSALDDSSTRPAAQPGENPADGAPRRHRGGC